MKSKVSTAADDLASRDVDAKEKLQNLATLATKTQGESIFTVFSSCPEDCNLELKLVRV